MLSPIIPTYLPPTLSQTVEYKECDKNAAEGDITLVGHVDWMEHRFCMVVEQS